MQSTSAYDIGWSSSWGSDENLVNLTDDIISSIDYFDDLTFTNIVFASDIE